MNPLWRSTKSHIWNLAYCYYRFPPNISWHHELFTQKTLNKVQLSRQWMEMVHLLSAIRKQLMVSYRRKKSASSIVGRLFTRIFEITKVISECRRIVWSFASAFKTGGGGRNYINYFDFTMMQKINVKVSSHMFSNSFKQFNCQTEINGYVSFFVMKNKRLNYVFFQL